MSLPVRVRLVPRIVGGVFVLVMGAVNARGLVFEFILRNLD